MKILVTGAKGQVGSRLVEKLSSGIDTNVELLAVDRHLLDITDELAVNACIERFRPDVVINAAAYTAVDRAEQDELNAKRVNHLGPLYLAVATNKIKATMIHVSTDYVFSGDAKVPYIESDTVDPRSVYGETKLAGEQAVINANPQHFVLRTSWVFGETGANFVKTMLRVGRERSDIRVVCDQLGSPTYAGDIADTLIAMAKRSIEPACPWGIYHFSGLPYVSWHEFAQYIFDEAYAQRCLNTHIKVKPITTSEYPTAAKRPLNSRLNCTKITTNLGIYASEWRLAFKDIKAYL
ncbi:dTDP-4-dehydrorhamnose reductase [Shewanella xiamenensis]|uniref:dTDP-4-dehydrorhamnose reductase n=1 Tax=Shewanella xiamenensis TaxID=332186 RepID=UPI0035B9E47E